MVLSLFEKAKKLPDSPGMYIFLDKSNKPLYVGRTVSLRKRVLSYFKNNIDSRIKEMVGLARKIRVKKTKTLLEAIILEANDIKRYWPKYNIKDKDNRSFVYVVISKSDYPAPYIVRERQLDDETKKQSHVFGPYQSASLLKAALRIIRRIFPYSTCKPFSKKPCFESQINLCPGLCTGKISKKDYNRNIKNIILLLSGRKQKLLKELKKENPEKIKALDHIQDVSLFLNEELTKPSDFSRIEGYDISHLSGKEAYGSMVVFSDSKPDKSQYRLFKIKSAPQSDDLRALEEVISRRLKHKEWQYPDLILIDGGKPQVEFIFKSLKKERMAVPVVGISKYKNDKLVYPPKTKKSVKSFAEEKKDILLKIREEAHRFGLKYSRKKRGIK